MNKNMIIISLVLVVVLLLGVSGYLYFNQSKNAPTEGSAASSACIPATGETAFSGKVASVSPPGHPEYKQYTLQSASGITYYLRITDAQAAILSNKLGQDAQVNGTLVTPNSSDVNVKIVCP